MVRVGGAGVCGSSVSATGGSTGTTATIDGSLSGGSETGGSLYVTNDGSAASISGSLGSASKPDGVGTGATGPTSGSGRATGSGCATSASVGGGGAGVSPPKVTKSSSSSGSTTDGCGGSGVGEPTTGSGGRLAVGDGGGVYIGGAGVSPWPVRRHSRRQRGPSVLIRISSKSSQAASALWVRSSGSLTSSRAIQSEIPGSTSGRTRLRRRTAR